MRGETCITPTGLRIVFLGKQFSSPALRGGGVSNMYQRSRTNRYREPMVRRARRKTAEMTRQDLLDYGVPEDVVSILEDNYDLDDIDALYDIQYYEDVYNERDLGIAYVESIGGPSSLGEETLKDYFDYEAFGRDLVLGDGFVIENGVAVNVL